MTSPTNEQQRVDVLAVMDCMNDLIRGEFIGPDDLDLTDEGLIEKGQQVRAAVAELIEAAQDVIDSTVTAHGYPDGPCIDRTERERLIAALAKFGTKP